MTGAGRDPTSSAVCDPFERRISLLAEARVQCRVTAHRRRCAIILPDDASPGLRPIREGEQHNLTRSIAGRGWLKEIVVGTPVRAIAGRENRSERMIRMLLSLAFLDPKLVRAALHGSLPRGVSARHLIDASMGWHAQRRALDLSRPN